MIEAQGKSEKSLDIRAGVLAAVRWGLFGAIAAAVAVAMRDLNVGYLDAVTGPVIGTSAILGCAGWAARASRPPLGMGSVTFIILVGSIFMWILAFSAQVTPRRLKSIEHPAIYPSEVIALLTPPILIAALITLLACTNKSRTEEGVGNL